MTTNIRSRLYAGAAEFDITPELGVSLAGSTTVRIADSIHAPLKAKMLILQSGATKTLFCSLDLTSVSHDIMEELHLEIEKRTQIPRANMMIGATHTHCAPGTRSNLASKFEPKYTEYMKSQVIAAAEQANSQLQLCSVGIGKGEETQFTFNRRLRRKDGRIAMNFIDSEELADCTADGQVDTQIAVMRVIDKDQRLIAMLVNYANHNNVLGGTAVSPDYAGYMGDFIQQEEGYAFPVLFFAGAAGNINWLDYRNRRDGEEEAIRIGRELANTVQSTASSIQLKEELAMDATRCELSFPHHGLTWIDYVDDGCFGRSAEGWMQFYRDQQEELAMQTEAPYSAAPIHVVRVGDFAFVSVPGELFVEFGLEIKRRSPFGFDNTFVFELTNGYTGYICTPQAFSEGGYEVRRTTYSSFLPEHAGGDMVKAAYILCCTLFERMLDRKENRVE